MKITRALQILAALVLVSTLALMSGVQSAPAPALPTFSDIVAPFTGVSYGSAAAWGDYDNDGRLDILLAGTSSAGKKIELWHDNNGDQLFTKLASPGLSTPVNSASLNWGDYDGDGRLDVLLTGLSDVGDRFSAIYHNDGGGTFTALSQTDAPLAQVSSGTGIWGDYTGDGRLDVLITGGNSSNLPVTKLYSNNGDGTFSEDTANEADLPPLLWSNAAWGDYNSDGRLDLALGGCTGLGLVAPYFGTCPPASRVTHLYENTAAGFVEAGPFGSGDFVDFPSFAWGDFNSDGDLDLAYAGCVDDSGGPCTTYMGKVYENTGGGTFEGRSESFNGIWNGNEAWADYDNDGYLDLLVSGGGPTGSSTTLYKYNSTGDSFTALGTPSTGLSATSQGSVAWGDHDRDGYLDVLATGNTGSASIATILRNTLTSGANTAPSAPTGLDARATGANQVTFSWNAASDAQTPQAGLTYNVSVRDADGFIVSPQADLTTGVRRVAAPGNAGHRTQMTISDLPDGTYYWTVQAVDSAFAGSAFATEKTINPAEYTFSTGVFSAGESDGNAQVTIEHTGLGGTVHIASSDGTATAGADYTPINKDVAFASDQASATVSIPILDDTQIESPETINLTLSSPSSGALGSTTTATLTIDDSDRTFKFASATFYQSEASGPARILVDREGYTFDYADTVRVTTSNGTATAGSDYTAVNTTLSFAKGETSKSVEIPLVNDTLHEGNETVNVTLSSPSTGAILVSPSTTVLTIGDDDAALPPTTTTTTQKPPAQPAGKIASAKLSAKSFSASKAGKVKLTVKFSPRSKVLKWAVSLKHGKKWLAVKSARKTSPAKTCTMTMKQLFSGKKIKAGVYRLKLSADRNSKTLSFTVR
ncbi:MAG: FG-GAP-like repeat-containing protein [Gaiellaceae bacterium]